MSGTRRYKQDRIDTRGRGGRAGQRRAQEAASGDRAGGNDRG